MPGMKGTKHGKGHKGKGRKEHEKKEGRINDAL